MLKSSDAITWELISLSPQLARNKYEKIVFGNGIFVLKDRMRCYTTTDGTDLALHSTPEPPSGGDVCFAGNKFFLSCRTKNFISTNGIEWTDITKEFALIFPVIKYFNNEIIGTTAENKLIGINKYTVDGIREDVAKLNSALSTLKTKTIGCYTGTGTVSTPLIAGTWNTWIDAPAIGKTPLAIIPTWSNTNVVLQLRYQSGSIQILPQAAVNNITIQYAILYFIF